MSICKIDVRVLVIDGTFDLEVWTDGLVALKLSVPKEQIDLMVYEIERRGNTVLSSSIGRWKLNANDGPVTRAGR